MQLDKVVANLIQKVEQRFYGKHRGFVVENDDPEKLGRLRLKVPSVLGNEVVTGWAMPCLPYGGSNNLGTLFIPEIDAGVWVEFEEGDLEFPIWVGTFWSKPGGESELPKPNDDTGAEEDSVQSPPTRKIIKTLSGHSIQFEDDGSALRILITDGENENRILFSDTGITVANKNNSVEMSNNGIVIEDSNGNKVTQDSSGTKIEDSNGNEIVMDGMGGFPAGPGVTINAGTGRVCMEDLVTWLMSHQHIGNMGAPTPLFPANIPDLSLALAGVNTILSKKLKVE